MSRPKPVYGVPHAAGNTWRVELDAAKPPMNARHKHSPKNRPAKNLFFMASGGSGNRFVQQRASESFVHEKPEDDGEGSKQHGLQHCFHGQDFLCVTHLALWLSPTVPTATLDSRPKGIANGKPFHRST